MGGTGNQRDRAVFNLKKTSMALFLLGYFLLLFAFAQTYANASVTDIGTSSSSVADVQVDQVTHSVKIQDYGLVTVNDTLTLSSENGGLLRNFSIGFPFAYGSDLEYSFAHNTLDPDERFNVKLDVGLEERIGFYGVRVDFPEPGVNLNDVESYNLTVVFVFSNLVSPGTAPFFAAHFPLYPSIAKNVSSCDVTVTLPPNSNYTDSIFEEKDLDFHITTIDSGQVLNHTTSPLESFRFEPAWLGFNATGSFPMFEVKEAKREIVLDQWGSIQLSDFYQIINKGNELFDITMRLPGGINSSVSARDELGDLSLYLELPEVLVTFRTALQKDEETKFTLTYSLPWENYVSQHDWSHYDLTLTFLEQIPWIVEEMSVIITLPEGAEFQSSSPQKPYGVEKSVFQETVTFTFLNVTPFNDLDFDLRYNYFVFWASFRPTLWMGVLVVIVGAIALLWQAPRPTPVSIVPVPPKDLKSFVEDYERKTEILLELESMEERLKKGKIPRRQYKVRKKMLEGRLSSISRDLGNLRDKIRAADRRYANIMGQIEVAETMLEGAETDIRRVETRYRRGDISKGAYNKLLEEYHRRRENAKTTIDGFLLRLREEIH